MKVRLILLAAFVIAAVALLMMDSYGAHLAPLPEGVEMGLAGGLGMVAAILAAYEVCLLAFGWRVQRRRGAPTEIKMMAGLLRFAVVLSVLMVFLHCIGKLSGSWAAIMAFVGMFAGWSLQAPVSGLAAWVMVNVKRPFRLGDRVQLPTYGLIGDVTQVGMMYTVLNQVGGTVGSEEAAGRNVLIPNAMLFGNIVINYTPEHTAAFVLDEVIVRITYDSDWAEAERILLEAASEVTGDIIQQTGQKPYIRSDLYDYGVYMRLRYMTMATDRPRIVHEITKRVFRDFQATPKVDFAIPYVYSYRTGVQAGGRHLESPASAGPMVQDVLIGDIEDAGPATKPPDFDQHIAEMSQKIGQLGLLQPIIVGRQPNGRYHIIAGHLRLEACRKLGWRTIPAVVREPGP